MQTDLATATAEDISNLWGGNYEECLIIAEVLQSTAVCGIVWIADPVGSLCHEINDSDLDPERKRRTEAFVTNLDSGMLRQLLHDMGKCPCCAFAHRGSNDLRFDIFVAAMRAQRERRPKAT